MKRLPQSALLVTLVLLFVGAAGADEIADAAQGLCEKVKTCAMSDIAEEDLTPEMRQMMQPMLDNMCDTMKERVGEVPTDNDMYEPAVACMRSMEALSCDAMKTQQVNTPACQAYEKMARESYAPS